MGFGVYTIFRGKYRNDIYSKMSQNFLVLKFTQKRAKLLVRIKNTFFLYGRNCSSTIRQPKFPVELLFCSYFIFNSLFNHRPFFPICPLKNSGINSILPNKRVGFKANSSLVYWVYQSLSYEKT